MLIWAILTTKQIQIGEDSSDFNEIIIQEIFHNDDTKSNEHKGLMIDFTSMKKVCLSNFENKKKEIH